MDGCGFLAFPIPFEILMPSLLSEAQIVALSWLFHHVTNPDGLKQRNDLSNELEQSLLGERNGSSLNLILDSFRFVPTPDE